MGKRKPQAVPAEKESPALNLAKMGGPRWTTFGLAIRAVVETTWPANAADRKDRWDSVKALVNEGACLLEERPDPEEPIPLIPVGSAEARWLAAQREREFALQPDPVRRRQIDYLRSEGSRLN
jgi:hypothetical protein